MSNILEKLNKLLGDETVTGDVAINTASTTDTMARRKDKKKKKKKNRVGHEFIEESTTLTAGQDTDDDSPPGNIIMGLQHIKKDVQNRLTGNYRMSVVDDKESLEYDEMRNTAGMEDPNLYHDSLKKSWGGEFPLDDMIPDYDKRVHKHIKRRDIPDSTINRKGSEEESQYRGTMAFTGNDRPHIPYADDVMKQRSKNGN